MNAYLILKTLHIVSSTLLFGTGLGIAFFKWAVDRSANRAAIRLVAEKVVLADWLFTTPAIVVQLTTGLALSRLLGVPLVSRWLLCALILFCIAGVCWLPVVALQIRMRNLARTAERHGEELSERYWVLARWWFWLGVAAFTSVLVIFWLMIVKPP